jgi:hypothetical protein
MNRTAKLNVKRSQSKVPELAAYTCPSCHRLVWGERNKETKVSCPFCSSGLPTYLNKVTPTKMIMRNERPQDHHVMVNDANRQSTALTEEAGWTSPFIHEFFLVQGSGFRCMAYRNDDGKWRGAFSDEVLQGSVRVLG